MRRGNTADDEIETLLDFCLMYLVLERLSIEYRFPTARAYLDHAPCAWFKFIKPVPFPAGILMLDFDCYQGYKIVNHVLLGPD